MGLNAAFKKHSRAINILTEITLVLIIFLCYALYIILFVSPSTYVLDSLITPAARGLKPTTAVTLISTLFVAATSALVTKGVEQSLWLKLSPRNINKPLTWSETHRLAQWSVSPISHLVYLFDGSFILLKIAGPLLVAIVIVSPVLISGVSVSTSSTSSIAESPRRSTRGTATSTLQTNNTTAEVSKISPTKSPPSPTSTALRSQHQISATTQHAP